MWATIIEQLEAEDAIGNAIPIQCHHHQDEVQYIAKPGVLPMFSPDGLLRPFQSFPYTFV